MSTDWSTRILSSRRFAIRQQHNLLQKNSIRFKNACSDIHLPTSCTVPCFFALFFRIFRIYELYWDRQRACMNPRLHNLCLSKQIPRREAFILLVSYVIDLHKASISSSSSSSSHWVIWLSIPPKKRDAIERHELCRRLTQGFCLLPILSNHSLICYCPCHHNSRSLTVCTHTAQVAEHLHYSSELMVCSIVLLLQDGNTVVHQESSVPVTNLQQHIRF